MNKKIISLCLGFISLLILVVAGCVTTAEMFQGNAVSPVHVIAMQDSGPQKGYVENSDIMISYEFIRADGVLRISGEAFLTERFLQNYPSLKYLYVYLFFVDEASRVVETVSLATAMTASSDEHLEFSQSMIVPDRAVGLSFGYDGEVKEGGARTSSSHSIYRLPLK